jgi:hypothetical protein
MIAELMQAPVLAVPNFNKTFCVHILMTKHTIAYSSKHLVPSSEGSL